MLKNTISLLFLVFSVSSFAAISPSLCVQPDVKKAMERYKWNNGFADQDVPHYTSLSPMTMGLIRDGRYQQDGDMVLFFHKKEHQFYLYVYEDDRTWDGFIDTLHIRQAMLSTFPIVLINRSPSLETALRKQGWQVASCDSPI